MKFAYDVPGYVQGHRFSDRPDYYDAGKRYFRDLAGGDRFGQGVSHVVGTPVFSAFGPNTQRGLSLDNTCHWQFPHVCPWMGSGLAVVALQFVAGGTNSFYPWIFGDATTVTNNGLIHARHNAGSREIIIKGYGGLAPTLINGYVDGQIAVIAWSRNQQDRICRMTRDGVTITESAPYDSASVNGNGIGLTGAYRTHLGNLNGIAGNTTPSTTGTLHLFEQHFWSGDVLKDHSGKLAEFISSLKTVYGLT